MNSWCAVFRKPVGCCPWKGSPVRSGWLRSGSWTPFPAARPSSPRWEMRYCPQQFPHSQGILSPPCLGLFYPAIFAGSFAQGRLRFDNFVNSQAVCCLQIHVLRPFLCTGNLGLAGRIGCASSPARFLMIPVLKHRAVANLGADINIFNWNSVLWWIKSVCNVFWKG